MLLEWFVLLCLLSVPIHVAATHNETHAVFTRAADESLDALSQDLLHFVTLSVQLNVRDKMKQGPLDVQSLADRISDLGVSFWELDQGKVADLEAQLTAIGSGVDTECSAGCALPTEVTAGFGVIDILKGKEAVVQAAFDVSRNPSSGGKLVKIATALEEVKQLSSGADFNTATDVLNNRLTDFKDATTDPQVEKDRIATLEKLFTTISTIKNRHSDLTAAQQTMDALTQNDMSGEADIVKKCEGLPDISNALKAENAAMDAFKQSSAVFAGKIKNIKALIEQNKQAVLAELKILEKLNVGSKFLNYFDNSFTASKWLTKLLAGKEDKNLDAFKEQLKDVKSIGEKLDPLRTSVENVNSLKAHQVLLDIGSLLEKYSGQLMLDFSKSSSELAECVKDAALDKSLVIDVATATNNLNDPETNIKEFKESLNAYLTAQKTDLNFLTTSLTEFRTTPSAMVDRLKKDDEIKKFTDALARVKAGVPTINTVKIDEWLKKINIASILADSKKWIEESAVLTSLKCLRDTDSIASVNAQVGGVQDVGKLGKSDANAANAIKVATELKAAIDQWKQLAAPPTRRRRAPGESTSIDELIVSTMAVRRLIRACSKGTLATLIQGLPQLDATVKATFEQVISSCEVLKEKAASATKVSDLSHVLLALNPLGDTFIDTVKLADELAPTTSDAAVQQALQDLKEIDLNFARHDSPKVGQALDSLEVDFANLLGSSGKEPETIELNGCVGGDCEEPSSSVGLVIGIVAVVVVVLVLGGGAIYYFSVYRPKQQAKKGNDDEKGGDEDKKKKDGKNDRKKGKKSGTDSKTNSKGEEKSEEPKQAPEGGNAPPPEQQPPGENPEQPVAKIAKSVEVEKKKVEVKKEAQKTKKKTSKVDPKAYEEAKERKKTEQELINDKFRANVVEMGPNKIPTSFTYENLLQGMERAREYDAKMARLENQVECSPAKYLSGDQVPTIYRYLVGPEDEILVNTDKDLSSQRVEKTQRSARTTTTTTSQERSSAGVEGPSTSSTRSLAEFEKYLLEIEASLDDLGVPHFKDMVPDKVPDKSLPTVWIGGDGWTDEQIAELESFATVHKGDN